MKEEGGEYHSPHPTNETLYCLPTYLLYFGLSNEASVVTC